MSTWVSVGIVLALILVEAVFVAAEISLVSLRESQVRAMAEQGRRGARVARLVSNPNRFLAAVQLGVTLTSLLSSAYGAVTLSDHLGHALRRAGLAHTLSSVLGFLGVTIVITLVTLVIGELAPKRLALQRAEGVAQFLAGPLERVAVISRPVIWFLSKATDGVVRLLGGDPSLSREQITEEELRGIVASHESLDADERRLIDDVFAAAERTVREVMLPRTEVEFLDAGQALSRAQKDLATAPHSRYPVVRGSADDVVGFVHVRDLYTPGRPAAGLKVGDIVRPVKMLPGTKTVLPALSEMRREGHHLAIVVDEYGGTAGIVTLEDLIEEVVGDIRDEYDATGSTPRRLLNGAIEVDGLLNLDDFLELTGVRLPDGPYETAAGFVVGVLGHVPAVGEEVDVPAAPGSAGESVVGPVARLRVLHLDGRRIDRLRVVPVENTGDLTRSGAPERVRPGETT